MLLREALGSLPERERRVVYLRFYLGLTQSEIAEEIGVSQVHVSRILRSTLAQLGDELGDDGGRAPRTPMRALSAGAGPGVVAWRGRPTERPEAPCSLTSVPGPSTERTERAMSSTPAFTVEVDDPDGDRVSIRVKGELDLAATPTLTQAIVGAAGSPRINLDLSGVTFLDSSAIGALVASGREVGEAGSRLEIGPRSDIVNRVLEITGLAESSEAFDVLPDGRLSHDGGRHDVAADRARRLTLGSSGSCVSSRAGWRRSASSTWPPSKRSGWPSTSSVPP